MYFCTVVVGDNLHENNLILEDSADIMEWGNVRREALDNAISHVISSSTNDGVLGSMPLYFIAKKYTTDGMAVLAAADSEDFLTWGHKAHDHLNDQFRTMFEHVDSGNVIAVNPASGYFTVKKSEISATPSMIQCKMEVTDELLDKFVLNGIVPNYNSTTKYFCYAGNGRCVYEPVFLHDVMLRMHKYDVDKAYKFIYYTSEAREHEFFNDYGVKGLRDSVAYQTIEKPFELNSSDLDAIEKFIKENFEKCLDTIS